MSDETPPNVKIYDRPASKGPSPVILAICLLAALLIGFFVYRAFQTQSAPAADAVRTGDSRLYRGSLSQMSCAGRNFSVRICPREG